MQNKLIVRKIVSYNKIIQLIRCLLLPFLPIFLIILVCEIFLAPQIMNSIQFYIFVANNNIIYPHLIIIYYSLYNFTYVCHFQIPINSH